MYLKRLDLQGFKSFPDKIKLEFNKGITAIVGPNGSGKSNISDSIRWVLGEQKARSLRGDKMEDVIFTGTESRKPLGFAEVAITLDNSDGKIPLEYSEITVSRTVFRSGESKYMINGTQCRLKDVHELFMDTGIGREGYSIIGQGRIDEILSNKSEDRRRLFEEAAGIVKYRTRRLEAAGKLEKEHENLLRVNDIIGELETKTGPLAQQSETAKKYLRLKEELKKYEVNNFCIQAGRIEKSISEITEAKGIMFQNAASEKEAYENSKILYEKLKVSGKEVEAELEKTSESISVCLADEKSVEGEINLINEQIQYANENIKRIENENSQRIRKLEDSKNEEGILKARLTAISVNHAHILERLKTKEEEFGSLSGSLEKNEETAERFKTDIIEKIKDSTDIKSNIQRLETMLEQFTERKKRILDEKDFNSSRLNEINIKISALNKIISEEHGLKNRYESEIESIVSEKDKILNLLDYEAKEYQRQMMQLNECKSRFKVLSEMKNEHEGFFKSVKSILKLKGSDGFNGICGAFGELIGVEKKYETAIETAIGGAIQHIVTETEIDGKNAIEYLKRNNLGRATFLPLSVIKGRGIENGRDDLLRLDGVIGIASELVKFDKKYENVILNVLGRAVIAEDINSALNAAKKTGHKYKIVTLDGDILNPGGTMTGGSIAKKSSNIFSRSREIEEFRAQIENLEKKCGNILSEMENKKSEAEKLDAGYKEKTEKVQSINISCAAKSQELEQFKQSYTDRIQAAHSLDMESNALTEQIGSAQKDISEFEDRLSRLQNEIDEIDKYLREYQGAMQSDKIVRDEIYESITELKIEASSAEQEKKSALESLERILNMQKQINDEILNADKEKNNFVSNMGEKENRLKKVFETGEALKVRIESLENLRNGILEKINLIHDEIKENEEKKQNSFENINKLESRIFKLETKLEGLEEEKKRIYNTVWEEYEITYRQAQDMFDETIPANEISEAIKEIKSGIKALGNVNVNAIEEFREVKGRYDFLTAQRDDIINAEEKLKKIISELSQLMENQFKEQFKLISENFNSVFMEMFWGGKAYLKMTDEENALESGIEIIAQPPGKNLQNMMLLSGGERALTAIAILFSILKMKPSPFCILDEIEAALDDANVKRFADYLKKFSCDTQFIVITHRKGTMESADVMYGITMQEHGVSKIVSVKFEDGKGA